MPERKKKPTALTRNLSTAVIVGRTNVGKSSLFNRLIESGKALTSKIAGTTRDYNIGTASWQKKTFEIIDTGGVNIDNLKNSIQSLLLAKKGKKTLNPDAIENEIINQTKTALKKADVILMVVDGQAGLMPQDKELALVLKKLDKPVLLVCNKIDSLKYQAGVNEFYRLGLGTPLPVSAANGSGTGDMLDELTKKIKGKPGRLKKSLDVRPIRVAIIGKPNVGKSSLVNKILGEQRVIVSDIPQTTREPQDTEIVYKDKKLLLIDTAGLGRKAKVHPGIEKMAGRRTLGTIKSADIIIFVTEVDKPLTTQDSHLAGLIKDSGAGIIIAANKWDLLEERPEKIDTAIRKFYLGHFPFLSYAPLIFISALTGRGVDKIFDIVLEVNSQREKEVSKTQLKKFLARIVKIHYPAQAKGEKRPHIYDLAQTKTNPPQFTVTVGPEESLHFSYLRFMENQLRQNFGFTGVPINLRVTTLKR